MLNAIKLKLKAAKETLVEMKTRVTESRLWKLFVGTVVVAIPVAGTYVAANVFLATIGHFVLAYTFGVAAVVLMTLCLFVRMVSIEISSFSNAVLINATRAMTTATVILMMIPILIPSAIIVTSFSAAVKIVTQVM